ncbi:MAG: hypothetical protein JW820_02795 [Spirochaetales bacterium]|nr:hypothetical protein [Spirochaetales bacterium]
MKKSWILPVLASVLLILTLGACVTTTECRESGQVMWDRGADPERDAPKWVGNERAAIREAGLRYADVPKRAVVFVGHSEDLNNEKGARFEAVDDALDRYAVYVQDWLDIIIPQAAEEVEVRLPDINTALGADRALGYLPKEELEGTIIKAQWLATGRLCEDAEVEPSDPVYRVYVLVAVDRDTLPVHLKEAAKEAFKNALIRGEDRQKVLERVNRIIDRM